LFSVTIKLYDSRILKIIFFFLYIKTHDCFLGQLCIFTGWILHFENYRFSRRCKIPHCTKDSNRDFQNVTCSRSLKIGFPRTFLALYRTNVSTCFVLEIRVKRSREITNLSCCAAERRISATNDDRLNTRPLAKNFVSVASYRRSLRYENPNEMGAIWKISDPT